MFSNLTNFEIISIFAIVLAYLLGRYAINSWRKIEGAKLLQEEAKRIDNVKIDDSIIDTLDKMIDNILNEYLILKINPNEIEYITSKEEDAMREYIVDEISKALSDDMKKKLELVYSEDYIPDLIGRRVYFAVLNFVLDHNVSYSDKK